MAKKPKSKSVATSGIQAGHRDLAEILSTDYILVTNRTGWDQHPKLVDMNSLTGYLEKIDGNLLLATMHDRWAQGFLMGQLHQACVELENRQAEEDLDDEDYYDE